MLSLLPSFSGRQSASQIYCLIARVASGGSLPLVLDWDYFRLVRWPNNPSTPTPVPTETYTPTATDLPTETGTPTATGTPTETETPSETPTETATFTPSVTLTPSRTPLPTSQPLPTLPAPLGPLTITYEYDDLYRLTGATYSLGYAYHYTYDAVGNRLSQTITVGGVTSTVYYAYDDANRLVEADGRAHTYDNNGSLLSDGINTYTYDSANRLKTVTGPQGTVTYAYNGLGDRLRESANGSTTTFTMDLTTGLTQALSDGTHEYLYGNGRVAQANATGAEYFLGDALGSVRQLTDSTGAVNLAKAYDPYGGLTLETSPGSSYGYTGEHQQNGLVYLRARHYAPGQGRFLTRDTWAGEANRPMSYNRWMYGYGNPIAWTDPSGMAPYRPPMLSEYSLSIYCSGLRGEDLLSCEKIVRGINPEAQIPLAELRMSDFDDGCYINSHYNDIYKDLPHSVYRGKYTEYGWWWHYLLENTPGWWNNEGKGHVYFRDVIAFALAVELSNKGSDNRIVGYTAGAFATKPFVSGLGFYSFIGSRQSVMERVNTALYGNPKGGSYNIIHRGKFSASVDSTQYNIQARFGGPGNWGEKILRRTGLTSDQLLAYEWGNPLVGFEDVPTLDNFEAALSAKTGPGIEQVLFHDIPFINQYGEKPLELDGKYYQLFFILSQAQEQNLCGGKTCVRNTP